MAAHRTAWALLWVLHVVQNTQGQPVAECMSTDLEGQAVRRTRGVQPNCLQGAPVALRLCLGVFPLSHGVHEHLLNLGFSACEAQIFRI